MNNDYDLSDNVSFSSSVQKPTKQRFFVLSILFLSLSVIYLDRVNISIIAANTHFLTEMGLAGKPVYIGLLMSMFLITYGISNVILSPIGDFIGPRKAMLIAYLIISVSLILGGISSFFGFLIGTRILLGVGEGLYYPMQNTFVKNWFPPRERGRANTAWILGQSLSPAIAMPIFTWIIAAYSWRYTFYFSFALSLLPLLLIYFFTSNTPRENKFINARELAIIEEDHSDEGKAPQVKEKASLLARTKIYLTNTYFWMLVIIFASNSMLSWGVVTWLPTYLNTERGFSWGNVGWVSSLPFIFGLLFKIISGIAVDRTGKKGMIMLISALLCATAIFCGVNIDNNYLAAIMISFGIGASSMQLPCVFTLLQGMVPGEAISSAAGALNGMAVGFGALSPVMIGFTLSLTHNFHAVMYLLVAIVMTGAMFAGIFAMKRL
ncbi:MFS transporter [Kosakonia sp. BK9b]